MEGSLESMSHSSASKRFFSSRTLPPARILYWHDDAKKQDQFGVRDPAVGIQDGIIFLAFLLCQ